MSGYPDIEGVAEISALVAQSVDLEDEIFTLRKTINEAAVRLKIVEEEFTFINSSIVTKMEYMDVTSSGNSGWRRRLTHFLCLFYRNQRKEQL